MNAAAAVPTATAATALLPPLHSPSPMFPPPHPPPPSRQVLVGNKSDMDESKRAVAYARGQALADEFRLQFFETSAKSNANVDEVFQVRVCEGWCGWVF